MEYPMCTQSVKQKEFLVQLVQEKSSFFNRKFRHIRLFYFQKYRNFIGSRSCPNRTKLGMEYSICSQSVKQKELLVQIVQKKVRVSIGNIELFAYYKIILFSKIQKFYRVKEFSKSTQTRYGVSHVYLERKTKRIFGIACLRKKFVFQSEISTYSLILFSKIQKLYWIKELSKSNQTRYGVSHVQLECKTKRIFGIACLEKKFVFQSEISTYSLILFLKIQNFYWIKELSKSNQTRYGVSHVQLECKTKKNFWYRLSGKKLRVSIGNIDLFAHYKIILFSKIQKFYRVKEYSKSTQTRYGVSHVYLERKTKRIFGIACLEKKFVFQSEISTYSLILFLKIQNFYWIKELSKSNQTRYGVSHVQLECKTKKNFWYRLSGKKLRVSIGNIDLFAHYKIILFSKIQKFYRVKEYSKSTQTRYGVSHVYLERKTKRIFGIACLEKKFVFQSEISTYSLILFSKIQKFYWIKELSKSNQTRYGVSHVQLECITKKHFGIDCLEKNFVFQSEISTYSLIIKLFHFQKYRNFIGSRSSPNQPKIGMEYPMCTQSVKQK